MLWADLTRRLTELAQTLETRVGGELDPDERRVVTRPSPFSGDEGDVDYISGELENACSDIAEALESLARGKMGADSVIELAGDALENLEGAAEDIKINDWDFRAQFYEFLRLLRELPSLIDRSKAGRRDFYVYAHKDAQGAIFYIGKGTARRAWSRQRHVVWQKYVDEHLEGKYQVEVLRAGLQEHEADALESELIEEHGERLVNWVNPGRAMDYAALDRFHALRNANRTLLSATRTLEATDLEAAVTQYRAALVAMREYTSIVLERGVVADLMGRDMIGEPQILDRLTLCLEKLGHAEDIVREADAYFGQYPDARSLGAGAAVLKRVDRAKAGKLRKTRAR